MPRFSPLRRIVAPRVVAGLIAATVSGFVTPAAAQEVLAPETLTPPTTPHPFGPTDLWAMHRLAEAVPSPDGARVVYVETVYDVAANASTKSLWLVPAEGGEARRLTTPKDAKDYAPQWLPDGKTVAFISSRSGSTQIWAVRVDGGDPWQVSDLPVDVDNLRWSPAADRCAFTAEVFADATDLAATAARDKKLADDKMQARIYDSLQMRHWDSWETGKRNHIFVARVKDGKLDGAPVDLLKGAEIDAPVRPFGGREEYAWSPDGSEIAFTGKEKKDDATRTDNDVYLAKADGSAFYCITESNEATDTAPVYSPDGSTIAYLAMKRPGYESDRYIVTLRDRATGKMRVLTPEWDRSPGALAWSSDGSTIFATAGEEAREKIFAIDVASGKVTPVIGDHYNSEVSVARAAAGDRLVFLQDSYTSPADIFSARPDGGDPRRLTNANAPRLEGVELSQPEEFWFAGAEGDQVHGWIFKPAGYASGKTYPVAFLIHGGPQGSMNDHFHYRWNPQCYAGAGYAVIAIDFHGSTGYGQVFTDAIRKDWGGKPYEDLMLGLDYALANYTYLDATRVAGLGASYGGYMVFWINGHTDRFRVPRRARWQVRRGERVLHDRGAVVPRVGIRRAAVGRKPRSVYERWSPERFVANWKTPTLVIHGAKDYRLLDSEGMGAFTALQRLGVPSKFLHFPDENHWVLKPQNGLLWHETVLGWLDQWTKGETVAKPSKGTRGISTNAN